MGSMECSCKNLNKRLFIILPCIFLFSTTTIKAENENPTPTSKAAISTTLPILASTLATYNNLKSLNTHTATDVNSAENVLRTNDRRQMIAWLAESYSDVGLRYRYGGTSIENGIDCSGFTRFVLNYFDFKAGRSSRDQYEEGIKIPVAEAKPGDLVFFGGKHINHVAMVVSNDKDGLFVVHSTNRGIIKENIYESKYWKSKLRDLAVNLIDKK
ncbi:MAG TPA: C40 family peptidase [Allocoleopsis sp.]